MSSSCLTLKVLLFRCVCFANRNKQRSTSQTSAAASQSSSTAAGSSSTGDGLDDDSYYDRTKIVKSKAEARASRFGKQPVKGV
jgi:hypothetical protein